MLLYAYAEVLFTLAECPEQYPEGRILMDLE